MAKLYRHRGGAARRSTTRCRCSAGSACSAAQPVERLYREIRALRIYEGASEVQKLIIAAPACIAAMTLGNAGATT